MSQVGGLQSFPSSTFFVAIFYNLQQFPEVFYINDI